MPSWLESLNQGSPGSAGSKQSQAKVTHAKQTPSNGFDPSGLSSNSSTVSQVPIASFNDILTALHEVLRSTKTSPEDVGVYGPHGSEPEPSRLIQQALTGGSLSGNELRALSSSLGIKPSQITAVESQAASKAHSIVPDYQLAADLTQVLDYHSTPSSKGLRISINPVVRIKVPTHLKAAQKIGITVDGGKKISGGRRGT